MRWIETRARGWKRLGSVVATLALLGTTAITANCQDATKPAPPKVMAADADPDWEVATVKPSDPNDPAGQHMNVRGRQLRLLDTTVEQFLLLGYSVQKGQLADLPSWATTQRWDVEGVPDVEGEPSLKQLQGMIQKILAKRFGLQLHHEQREMPVYALTVAKGGPKMVANTSDPNGWLHQQNGENNGRHVEQLKNTSMAELAQILQFHVDRAVVDQTGLKGRWDFNLQWTVDDAPTTAPDAPPGLFTAIQDQIGLKLERVKAPADVLVIDKVERPEAN
jgi:uncharacterized protein (TIGR03435 family)